MIDVETRTILFADDRSIVCTLECLFIASKYLRVQAFSLARNHSWDKRMNFFNNVQEFLMRQYQMSVSDIMLSVNDQHDYIKAIAGLGEVVKSNVYISM